MELQYNEHDALLFDKFIKVLKSKEFERAYQEIIRKEAFEDIITGNDTNKSTPLDSIYLALTDPSVRTKTNTVEYQNMKVREIMQKMMLLQLKTATPEDQVQWERLLSELYNI